MSGVPLTYSNTSLLIFLKKKSDEYGSVLFLVLLILMCNDVVGKQLVPEKCIKCYAGHDCDCGYYFTIGYAVTYLHTNIIIGHFCTANKAALFL